MKTISAFPSLTSGSFYRLFKINPHLSMPIPHLFHYICYRTVMHTRCGDTNPWCFFLPDFYFIYGSFAWAPSHMGGLSVCLHPQKYTVSSFFASYLSGANLVPCSALIFRKRERKKNDSRDSLRFVLISLNKKKHSSLAFSGEKNLQSFGGRAVGNREEKQTVVLFCVYADGCL